MRCEPGDYLVVAYQDDSLFHEVYRHVPAPHEQLPGVFAHLTWRQDGDTIYLPSIRLFATKDVTSNMAHVDGGTFSMSTSDLAKDTQVDVAEFYVDVNEVTVGQLKNLGLSLPSTMTEPPSSDDMPLHNVTWHDAEAYAEAMGKRLPTDAEFEYLVTLGGTRTGDPSDWEVPDVPVPGPVSDAAFDRLQWQRLSQPVIGLRSNVLEWTASWWAGTGQGVDNRVVRGGYSLSGDPAETGVDYTRPPPRLIYYPPLALPRLGFRCARSAKPSIEGIPQP